MNAPHDMHDDAVARLRVPPHSYEAESSLLGGVMLDNDCWDLAADVISEGDFYRFEHRLIYGAIASLLQAGKTADVVTVFERLQVLGNADACGGLAYLNALAQCVPSGRNARAYAAIVRERSMLRSLIAASDEIAAAAFSAQDRRAADIADEAQGKIGAIAAQGTRKQPRPIAASLLGRVDRVSELADGKVSPGWSLGIPRLDAMLGGGVRPGELVILAARPSVGKSSLALQFALHQAQAGRKTLMCSQEMPETQVADRAIAHTGRINASALRTGRLEGDEWGRLTEAVDRLMALPLDIDDEGALRLGAVRAKARQSRCQVLVLDYLQLCSGSGKRGENRNSELEEITRGLKALAKSDGMAIIVLSQLNRDSEKRGNKRPQLFDLRDSGAIEQDADTVLMLWTHQRFDGSAHRVVGCAIEKQRDGPLGTVALNFDAATQRWEESSVNLDAQPQTARPI